MSIDKTIAERWRNTEILLLGGSAGSFKSIFHIVRSLPPKPGKAVVIIIHRKKNYFSEIEKMFADNSRMPMREISDKDTIKKKYHLHSPGQLPCIDRKRKMFRAGCIRLGMVFAPFYRCGF